MRDFNDGNKGTILGRPQSRSDGPFACPLKSVRTSNPDDFIDESYHKKKIDEVDVNKTFKNSVNSPKHLVDFSFASCFVRSTM